MKTIAELEREYERAFKAELKAVDALPERATRKQTDRCWELAAATNRALRALQAARDGLQHCDGCDADHPDVKPFAVTHHDGTTSNAAYCGDCAALARVDWNGETQRIQEITP